MAHNPGLADRYLEARRKRVEEVRALDTIRPGYLHDTLVNVQKSMIASAQRTEAGLRAAMDREVEAAGTEVRWDLGQGFSIVGTPSQETP